MEETEQSITYHNDLDEEIKVEGSVEREDTGKHTNHPEQHNDCSCGCNEKNFFGKKCECITIKEDIRTLFSLGEFIDKLIAKQKQALQTPLEQSKQYNMLDMVFEMNFKFVECFCEPDQESYASRSNGSESEQSIQKEEPHGCRCPKLPRKRCVLRIIRNDIYQRMKLVKKFNFLLSEKNKKIKEMIKRKEKNDPCSPYVTKSISFDEPVHKLIERCRLLKEMKEKNVPKACLFDKNELLEHIGQHRLLTKPLRHIYLIEELASDAIIESEKESDPDKHNALDKSCSKEKDLCRCPETDKKIEFIKNFKNMIARLNPILERKEEPLDISKSETKTMEQLVREKRKEERQKLVNLLHQRKEAVQSVIEQHKKSEVDQLFKEVIVMLLAYLNQIEAELQLYIPPESNEGGDKKAKNNQKPNEVVDKLIAERNELKDLIVLLNEYTEMRNKEPPPDDEKWLLEQINGMLQNYLDTQKKYYDDMEKRIPGFKIAIFDNELEKDRIVAEICRDDDEKKNFKAKEADKKEPEGREKLRMLLRGMNKPHLYVVGNPLEKRSEKSQRSVRNSVRSSESPIGTNVQSRKPSVGANVQSSHSSVGTKGEASQPSVRSNKKELLNKLKQFQKKIDEKLCGEVHDCQYDILEKELLKEIEEKDPPLPREESTSSPNINSGEMFKMKLKCLAFEEGRKIVSQPDPFIPRQENLLFRKRLVRELGLKCKKEGYCCTEKGGSLKLMLKAAYDTEERDCRCTNRQKQLSSLENEFENIILQPEKHNINYVCGPMKFVNKEANKRMRHFIHKHAKKKQILPESDTDFISSLSKRKLVTEYNDSRFYVVWKSFKRQALLTVNMEAQLMTNERIIIRPQYQKRVKVLSGGRTGLDPLYAEYVNTGMLDGVVLGDDRNGPIPRTILQAIKELDSGEGVVIIILNEFEERLSFLFAIERARKLGINAELVLARDDISDHQPEKWRYGPRGHTGIVLQFKVAAGMAAKGYNLAKISRVTQGMQIATLDCYLTNYGPFVGSGIRSDKGYYIPGLQAEDVIAEIFKQLTDPTVHHSIVPEPGTKMIIVINKFRMCSDDIYSILSYVGKRITETGATVGRAYHGNFSALTKQGFAITLVKDWNDELIEFLDYPTTCVLWPPHLSGGRDFVMSRTRFHREHIIGAYVLPENVDIIFEVLDRTLGEIAFSMDKMLDSCPSVRSLLLNIVWILKPNLKRLPLDRPYLFLSLVGKVLNVNLPDVGKYFQLILVTAAQEFMKDPDIVVGWRNWCRALRKGTQSLSGYTKFKVGDGSILDFLGPITDALCEIKEGWSPLPFLYEGLERVKHLEKKEKEFDIGTILLGQFFRSMYSCLNESVGHYSNEDWWKVRPSPRILLVNESCKKEICKDKIPDDVKDLINEKEKGWVEPTKADSSVHTAEDGQGSEPSIEAGPLEEVEGDNVSAMSAAGIFEERLEAIKALSMLSVISGSWVQLL